MAKTYKPGNWARLERTENQAAPEKSQPSAPIPVLEKTVNWLGDRCLHSHDQHGDDTVSVARETLLDLIEFLRSDKDLAIDFLTDLTALDGQQLGYKTRFRIVYHFFSTTQNHRLRVKVPVAEGEAVPTLSELWPVANWYEREVWDMFGLEFEGHPGLKRILLYEEFEGHPLRKDYPIRKRQPLIGPNPTYSAWRAAEWPAGSGEGPYSAAVEIPDHKEKEG